MSSKFHPNFSGLNVRNDGPQPCIFVRTLSPITIYVQRHRSAGFSLHNFVHEHNSNNLPVDVEGMMIFLNPYEVRVIDSHLSPLGTIQKLIGFINSIALIVYRYLKSRRTKGDHKGSPHRRQLKNCRAFLSLCFCGTHEQNGQKIFPILVANKPIISLDSRSAFAP